MGSDFEDKLSKMDALDVKIETAHKEQELAEAQAAEKEAKRSEGKDWKKVLGIVKSLKVDTETAQSLHGMGFGGLRDYNDPRSMRRR